MKKIIGIVLSAMLTIGAAATVFAAEDDIMLISENHKASIVLNNEALENAEIVKENDTAYFPLRTVCEKLGFEVEWNDGLKRVTVTNLPVYVTFSPFEDGYTFAKTSPIKIGIAPVVKDGATYVPIQFMNEILGGFATLDGDDLVVLYGNTLDERTTEGTVSEIITSEDGKVTQIAINNGKENEQSENTKADESGEAILAAPNAGDIILNVGENVTVTNSLGDKISLSDIKKGDKIKVIDKGIMTMSIPPQMPVYAITVLD